MGFADRAEARDWIKRWIAYVGIRRLVTGSVMAVLAALVAWLLFKPSGVAVEAMLPMTSGAVRVTAPAATATSSIVVVHVAGAVKNPGVYRLPASARVVDAITKAGGASSRADLESINLAQTIIDTEQIFVPTRGTSRSVTRVEPRLRPRRNVGSTVPTPMTTAVQTSGEPSSSPGSVLGSKINLNSATASQLDSLPGVGPTTARAIIAYRTKHGPYTKVEDLLNVSGIGPSKLAAMRERVTV